MKVEKTRKKTLSFRAQRFETDFWRSVQSMDALDGETDLRRALPVLKPASDGSVTTSRTW